MSSRSSPVYIQIDPSDELTFNYIPRKYLHSSLKLTNITNNHIAFKIKTNVPICYLVKPHLGLIPPGATQEINITMQPTDYNPQNASLTDKFLINAAPLPANTDPSQLSETTKFQAAWDSVSKNVQQANKLKVVLKFENSGGDSRDTTTVLDRTTSIETRAANVLEGSGKFGESGESREKLEHSGSLGTSFSSEMMTPTLAFSRGLSTDTVQLSSKLDSAPISRGGSMMERGSLMERVREVDVDREKERETEKKSRAPGNLEERRSVRREDEIKEAAEGPELKEYEERTKLLEKRLEELTAEKRVLSTRYEDMVAKGGDQRKMLMELSEENTRLKSELANLKSSTFKERSGKTEGLGDISTYPLWQMILVAIIALLLGIFLKS